MLQRAKICHFLCAFVIFISCTGINFLFLASLISTHSENVYIYRVYIRILVRKLWYTIGSHNFIGAVLHIFGNCLAPPKPQGSLGLVLHRNLGLYFLKLSSKTIIKTYLLKNKKQNNPVKIMFVAANVTINYIGRKFHFGRYICGYRNYV